MDLVIADEGQTGAIYFIAGENDLQYGLKQPWTSIGLDASEVSLDGLLFEPHNHPRAYGSMPRFLGHYVRDLHLLPLEQGIRKMTSLPAQRERLRDRGLLKDGYLPISPSSTRQPSRTELPTKIDSALRRREVRLCQRATRIRQRTLTGVAAGKALRGPGWRRADH